MCLMEIHNETALFLPEGGIEFSNNKGFHLTGEKVGSYQTLSVVLTTLALQCMGVMGGNKNPAHTPTFIP